MRRVFNYSLSNFIPQRSLVLFKPYGNKLAEFKQPFSTITPRDNNWECILTSKIEVENYIMKNNLDGTPFADALRSSSIHYQYVNIDPSGKSIIFFGNTTTSPITYLKNEDGTFFKVENQQIGVNAYNNKLNYLHTSNEIIMHPKVYLQLGSRSVSSGFLLDSSFREKLTAEQGDANLFVVNENNEVISQNVKDLPDQDSIND